MTKIEEMARPIVSKYTRNAVEGKMEILYKLSKEVPKNGVIVEIGSLYGSTAILMSFATKPSVKIHCIELNVLPELIDNIRDHPKITLYQGSSDKIGKSWRKPIDLLFIDGDHACPSVSRDSKTWTSHVKKGGIVAWHDYNSVLLQCKDVKKAVDEFLEKSRDFEIIMPETVEKIIRVVRKKL